MKILLVDDLQTISGENRDTTGVDNFNAFMNRHTKRGQTNSGIYGGASCGAGIFGGLVAGSAGGVLGMTLGMIGGAIAACNKDSFSATGGNSGGRNSRGSSHSSAGFGGQCTW